MNDQHCIYVSKNQKLVVIILDLEKYILTTFHLICTMPLGRVPREFFEASLLISWLVIR